MCLMFILAALIIGQSAVCCTIITQLTTISGSSVINTCCHFYYSPNLGKTITDHRGWHYFFFYYLSCNLTKHHRSCDDGGEKCTQRCKYRTTDTRMWIISTHGPETCRKRENSLVDQSKRNHDRKVSSIKE